jgi:hypothetical protein
MADRLVLGPFFTNGGFKTWFWACCPNRIVAVPGGFWVTIRAAMFGFLGGLIGGIAHVAGQKKGNKVVDRLVSATEEELANEAGCIVYPLDELASIVCKRPRLGNPELIVNRHDGTRRVHGVPNPLEFDAIVKVLQEHYGELVQRP